MIKPVLSCGLIAKDASTVVLKDTTGAYNASTNTGGYGTPNATFSQNFGFRIRRWHEDEIYANHVVMGNSAIVGSGGYFLTADVLGLENFSSGIHHFKYYPLENTTKAAVLVLGSKVVTLLSGTLGSGFVSTAYKAVVFMAAGVASKIYLIDHTASFTSVGFSLTEAWGGNNSSSHVIWLATEADLKLLFTELAEKCLAQQIGKIPTKMNCDFTLVNRLTQLTFFRFASQIRFDCKDYSGADEMIRSVEADCTCTNPCPTCQ